MSDDRLVLTHGCSLSNLPLFVAVGEGLFADEGLRVEAPYFCDISSTAELLASGVADLGTAAFTQPLIDAFRPDPPVMVAGSGLMGISVLTREPVTDAAALAGQPVGTFRSDPMEVLLHDVLAAAGLRMSDVDLRYFDVLTDAIDAWNAGELAAVSLAEPFAGRIRAAGGHVLSDGTELWGNPFPDTTLVVSAKFLRERPEQVRAAIRAMLRADQLIQADLPAAVRHAAEFYPGFELEELVAAARRQPARVDIRDMTSAVYARWDSLRSLGLVPDNATAPDNAVMFDLLNAELSAETIKEPAR
ncbi:ABC transporter substrate-binding protein [Mycolicibacterium mengxianglii]|uniref:ABC transporter substrate-binding protein n=1 Tax=Mycolicibacterium mengxianglii TaxID=2736649 RepID=UPI0018EED8E5|nr:ABC transporter substrate-binding protein [Mycolicibacterium mengxianglii]